MPWGQLVLMHGYVSFLTRRRPSQAALHAALILPMITIPYKTGSATGAGVNGDFFFLVIRRNCGKVMHVSAVSQLLTTVVVEEDVLKADSQRGFQQCALSSSAAFGERLSVD